MGKFLIIAEIRDRESERKRRSIQKGSVKIMEEDVFYVDSNRGIATSSVCPYIVC